MATTEDSPPIPQDEITSLRQLSPQQWKSGIAAWLGWLFDGLDMHLYTVVAIPFVASLMLMDNDQGNPLVRERASWIQAAFLVGWALGGGFFGRIGDRLGRSRALALTILTYALFTGLSFFATAWWHMVIFRFLAALGIGGEWAVGASLLSETWPAKWRPWIAAMLQTGVNLGVLCAVSIGYVILTVFKLENKYVFLVGVLPALIVFWIRRAVPEPEEWREAKQRADYREPKFLDLFRGRVRHITILTTVVCATSLSGHWAFQFWYAQYMRTLPDVAEWTAAEKSGLVSQTMGLVMVGAITGNFLAGALAKVTGYRPAVIITCLAYFCTMSYTFSVPRDHVQLLWLLPTVGLSQGMFALFTMYLPPLFPTLLRTTGAGFCYNIGRIAAAVGTIYFGSEAMSYQNSLYYASYLFLAAAGLAFFLPELPRVKAPVEEPVD